jgi:DNA-binding MarR family transcriptional regulator
MPSPSTASIRKIAQSLANDCLGMRVRFLHRSLNAIYDDAFRPLGVTGAQVSILAATVQLGPVAPVDLGLALNIEKSTLSRNLNRMQEAGWIKITPQSRHQLVAITAKGQNLLQKAHPAWKEAQKTTRKLLGADQSQNLQQVANHLLEKLTPS